MKHVLPALVLFLSTTVAQAQLVNGSFEIDGQPSLEGWNNSCGEAISLPGGAPGSGDWHAGYPMGTFTQQTTCNGSFDALFQEMPWLVPENQQVTIGFWSKTSMDLSIDYFVGIECRFSFVNTDQVFSPIINTGSPVMPSNDWTYHTVQGMALSFQPDQPRAVGFVGYDTSNTEIMELDGIEILSIEEAPTAISSVDPAKVLGYYDAANEALVISKPLDGALLCFDASGRSVDVPLTGSRNGARTFGTASLAPGIYTAVSGTRSLRFLKQ